MNLFTKQKHSDLEHKLIRGEKVGRDKLGGWDQHIQTNIKQINHKDLLYSMGNYTQYLVITYNIRECKKCVYLYLYLSELLCSTPETKTTL